MCSYFLLLLFFSFSVYLVPGNDAHLAILRGTLVRGVDQFSYQVSTLYNNVHRCGGAIINDFHVLTVARCVLNLEGYFDGTPIAVLAGTKSIYNSQPPAVKVQVGKIYIPMEFREPDNTVSDIAVLMLAHSLVLSRNRHLKPIALPRRGDRRSYAGKTALIAGFGWNWYDRERDTGGTDGQLRFAETLIVSNGQEGYHYHVNLQKQICARIKQIDRPESAQPRGICQNDAGGPLVYNDTVIGLASIGLVYPSKCSERNSGSIYTRVSFYRKFIDESLNYSRERHHREIRVFEPYY